MSYLVISNTKLCLRGVLNDFNKSIFETQKQEEAHGNTKNKRKQKRRFCCEKNQFCFVVPPICNQYRELCNNCTYEPSYKDKNTCIFYSVQRVRSDLKALVGKLPYFAQILFWSERFVNVLVLARPFGFNRTPEIRPYWNRF